MILDKSLEFSDAQSIVGTAAAAILSTNIIDLLAAGRDLAAGEDLEVVIQIDTAVAAAGGAANVTFALVESAATDLGSPTTLWTSGAIAKATLVAGYQVARIKLPRTALRYIGCIYTPDTNDTTAGKVNAFMVKNAQQKKVYSAGYTIS